jgi:hypothetical protein
MAGAAVDDPSRKWSVHRSSKDDILIAIWSAILPYFTQFFACQTCGMSVQHQ